MLIVAEDPVALEVYAELFAMRIRSCAPLRVVGRRNGDRLDPDHFQLFTRPELTALRQEVIGKLTAA